MPDVNDAMAPCRGLIWAWHPGHAAALDEAAIGAVPRGHPKGDGLWLHPDRVAEEASRRLPILSFLTAVLLPPSLVAGIFGMNVPDLPDTAAPGGFWWAILSILALGALVPAPMGGLRLAGSAGRPDRGSAAAQVLLLTTRNRSDKLPW
ncbi:CorA family divalent cation transporter [Pseudoroseomonas globiformis]|uniref:CorA family divalent cation transporter n=1 Tax=Teichococcus globiformis TaxID=2307229 RepID=A0ABV7FZ85_9PROT